MNEYDLYSEFDIQKHKQTFINYLEVIILPNGKVEYAVPSHQEFLINYCMALKGITDRQEFYNTCPRDRFGDYMEWLLEESGCIALWNNNFMGNPNEVQSQTIEQLKINGLYKEFKEEF